MKYDALSDYLMKEREDIVSLSFSDLEKILSFPLPRSAYQYDAWWANGAHSQAISWMRAGFLVKKVDLSGKSVVFQRKEAPEIIQPQTISSDTRNRQRMRIFGFKKKTAPSGLPGDYIMVCGYPFHFLQELRPECDDTGRAVLYYPQNDYPKKNTKPLNAYGSGAFCRFSIAAQDVPGVYLWVVDGEIIYIGETLKLRQRFNNGYGNIQPVNCYAGGQTTNCKMNKVLLALYESGRTAELYFFQTSDNKRVELELLGRIRTRYNVKDN